MSKILVMIETDHEDPTEAVRSVANSLKRAGYDVNEAHTGLSTATPEGWKLSLTTEGWIWALEPEVNRP